MINFSNIASDTNISVNAVREYYQVLEDTFIGFMLPAWREKMIRKAVSRTKFYYFDLGVKHSLTKIKQIPAQSDLYGQAFEHFVLLEVRAYLSYWRKHIDMSYWCTKHGTEVDLIIGDETAIEIKTTNKTADKHFKNLRLLAEENICQRYILISHDRINRKVDQFEAIYWEDFLQQLWQDKIIA